MARDAIDLRFGAQGSGFRVQGSGFRVQGSGVRVQGSGVRVQGSGFRFPVSGFRVQGSGFRMQGLGRGLSERVEEGSFPEAGVLGWMFRGWVSRERASPGLRETKEDTIFDEGS